MVTLYRHPTDDVGQSIQDELEAIVIQHEVVTVETRSDLPERLTEYQADLPLLVDDGSMHVTPGAIRCHLGALRQLMADWDRFQSDACYIDDEGRLCGHESVRNEDGPGLSVNPTLQVGSS
jgi:hypothetical protein